MRLHRFHITEPVETRKEVVVNSAELANQIGKVFRMKTGDKAILFDGSGSDYECEIVANDKKSVTFNVVSASRSRYVPARKIYLCAAVVKKDNFEFIVEKATELGVTDIIPVLAERSEKKSLNEVRLKKIAVEASEQSGRGDVPVIHPMVGLSEALSLREVHFPKGKRGESTSLVVFHTEDKAFDKDEVPTDAPIAAFIGPEGGWSQNEFDLFHKNGALVRCLGPQVLRAETAVVAALSQIVF